MTDSTRTDQATIIENGHLRAEVARLRAILGETLTALRDVRSAANDGLDASQVGNDLGAIEGYLARRAEQIQAGQPTQEKED